MPRFFDLRLLEGHEPTLFLAERGADWTSGVYESQPLSAHPDGLVSLARLIRRVRTALARQGSRFAKLPQPMRDGDPSPS